MTSWTSGEGDGECVRHEDINRRITNEELQYVENAAREAGIWRFAHEF
jgi:hypothetical protein